MGFPFRRFVIKNSAKVAFSVSSSLFLAGSALAATAAKAAKREPVAAGFADWEGVEDRNFVSGRRIAPSDLRQRAVMVIVMDVEKLGEQLRSTCSPQRSPDENAQKRAFGKRRKEQEE